MLPWITRVLPKPPKTEEKPSEPKPLLVAAVLARVIAGAR